jgi:hypothetical protein
MLDVLFLISTNQLMLQKASNARKPRTVSVRFTFAEGGSSGFLNGLRERESERAHGAS